MKMADTFLKDPSREVHLFVIGETGRQFFASQHIPIEENFQYTAQDPTFNRARWIAGILLERYLSGDLDEIHVLYTRMENVMQSVAKDKRVLPITKPDMHGMAIPVDVRLEEFSLRPTPEEAMNAIVPNYVAGFIYGALVESFCSEQNARMMAMDAATDNADALLKDLNTMYNRARQAAGKSVSLAEAGGHRLMTGSQLNCGFANITTDTKEAMYAAMTPDDKTVYFYSYYAYMSWNFNSSAIRQGTSSR